MELRSWFSPIFWTLLVLSLLLDTVHGGILKGLMKGMGGRRNRGKRNRGNQGYGQGGGGGAQPTRGLIVVTPVFSGQGMMMGGGMGWQRGRGRGRGSRGFQPAPGVTSGFVSVADMAGGGQFGGGGSGFGGGYGGGQFHGRTMELQGTKDHVKGHSQGQENFGEHQNAVDASGGGDFSTSFGHDSGHSDTYIDLTSGDLQTPSMTDQGHDHDKFNGLLTSNNDQSYGQPLEFPNTHEDIMKEPTLEMGPPEVTGPGPEPDNNVFMEPPQATWNFNDEPVPVVQNQGQSEHKSEPQMSQNQNYEGHNENLQYFNPNQPQNLESNNAPRNFEGSNNFPSNNYNNGQMQQEQEHRQQNEGGKNVDLELQLQQSLDMISNFDSGAANQNEYNSNNNIEILNRDMDHNNLNYNGNSPVVDGHPFVGPAVEAREDFPQNFNSNNYSLELQNQTGDQREYQNNIHDNANFNQNPDNHNNYHSSPCSCDQHNF